MGTRTFLFLTCLLAGTLFGWLLLAFGASGWSGATAGLLIGILLWFALDLARARRVLRWLRTGAPAPAPRMHGAWGEMADRTARLLRQRDRQLRASDQRLQDFLSAIQASPNGVVLLDADNRIEWCSESAANQLDIDAKRDLAAHITNLVRAPAFVQYLAGQDYRHDVGIDSRRRAAPRASRLSLQVHPYGDGRKLLLARDITALEQADAMRRDFVANVSHEIRTPLTVVAGFVETLQSVELAPAEQAHYLQLMAQQTDRMQALVNDLLALSRLEGSPPPSAGHWVDVAAVMREVEQESRALALLLAGDQGVPPQAIRFDSGASAHGDRKSDSTGNTDNMASTADDEAAEAAQSRWQVAGSQAELRSALVNLVNNAVRYTAPSDAPIEVRFAPAPGGRFEWSVQDHGPGIAPEHLPRLSERFYRVDRSRSRETGGTGLGLAIAKHVAQRHGGELHIDSALGHGSRFALVLPASRVRKAPMQMGEGTPTAAALGNQ